MQKKKLAFKEGMRDAIPIALGYLAVSFSLGIRARTIGFTPLQGFVVSLLNEASAGEYVGFTLIAAHATVLELIIGTVITNARYVLMSASLSQKLPEHTRFYHRFLLAYGMTDELFGIGIAKVANKGPFYLYGAFLLACPSWAIGTSAGIIAGNVLPTAIVSALSVALYGMFIAIFIPEAKTNKTILILVLVSFVCSFLTQNLSWSEGTKTIVLTILIAGIAALVKPIKEEDHE